VSPPETHSGAVAAIDIGSISARLLIVDGEGAPLERRTEIVNLSRSLVTKGEIQPDRVEHLLAVMAGWGDLVRTHRVGSIRAVATETFRQATNGESVLDEVESILTIRPEIIGGTEEGTLSFAGATAELDPDDGPFLVIDLGGASTEFAVGTERCEGVVSIDVGARVLTERYISSDPPRPEELLAVLSVVEAYVDDVVRDLPQITDVRRYIGLAGTVSTAAAVEIGLATYDRDRIHHFVLTREAAEDVYRTLVTEPLEDRLHNPGLVPMRAEAIVGGITELVAIMRGLSIDELLVSEADLLDGVVARLVSDVTAPPPRLR